jgi:hypothetical protein
MNLIPTPGTVAPWTIVSRVVVEIAKNRLEMADRSWYGQSTALALTSLVVGGAT